jgi:hypothetical protein
LEAVETEDLYTTIVKMESDGTGIIRMHRTEVADKMFDAIVLELGEFLYQLRAALDSCVYQAATIDNGGNAPADHEKLEFPLCPSPAEFQKRAYKIAPLHDKRKALVKFAQPFDIPKDLEPHLMLANWNRSLGILHEWARKDRHRKLHVVGSWVSDANPLLRVPDGVGVETIRVVGSGFLEHNSEVACFKLSGYSPPMKVQANPNLFVDIAIDESPPMCAENDTFANRLHAMSIAATNVIAAIESSF